MSGSLNGVGVTNARMLGYDSTTATWVASPPFSGGGVGAGSTTVTVSNFSTIVSQGTNPWVVSGASTVAPLAGSTWNTRPMQSSASDLQMTATPVTGSTWATRPLQSSQADLRVTAYQSSAAEFKAQTWAFDSTGGGVSGSTKGVNLGVNALMVRPGTVDSTTFSARIATAGDNAIFSSVAAQSLYVYAIHVSGWNLAQSTGAGTAGSSGVQLRFQSGTTGATAWTYTYQTSTLTMFWDSMCVNPPNYLFKTAVAASLNCAATSTGAMVNVAAWRE